jgi:hypothetical protein
MIGDTPHWGPIPRHYPDISLVGKSHEIPMDVGIHHESDGILGGSRNRLKTQGTREEGQNQKQT